MGILKRIRGFFLWIFGIIGLAGFPDDIENWGVFISYIAPYIDSPWVRLLSAFLLGLLIANALLRFEKWRKTRNLVTTAPLDLEENTESNQVGPNWTMSEAIKHVVTVLFPDSDPNHINYGVEYKHAPEEVVRKIKSGELLTWGKRVRRRAGTSELTVNVDQEHFTQDDWKHRELLPLEGSIPTTKNPQTRSVGRSGDHIQLTGLYVNEAQVKGIQWREPTFEDDFKFYADKSENKLPAQMPLVEIMREAENQGWQFTDNGNNQIIDFVHALRDAGSTGEVQFWGRKKLRYDFVTSSQALGKISEDYWLDFKVDGLSCLTISKNDGRSIGVSTDNSITKTQTDANSRNENLYADIRLDGQQAISWLEHTKPEKK